MGGNTFAERDVQARGFLRKIKACESKQRISSQKAWTGSTEQRARCGEGEELSEETNFKECRFAVMM